MKQPRKFTFSDMRNIVLTTHDDINEHFFMAEGFSIGMDVNSVILLLNKMHEPLLMEDSRIMMLKKGGADITVNLIDHHVKAGMTVYCPKGCVVQINKIEPESTVQAMMFDDEWLNVAMHGRMPEAFISNPSCLIHETSLKEQTVIDGIMQTVWAVVHQPEHNVETVQSLVAALIYYYANLKKREIEERKGHRSREIELFEQFMQLVNMHGNREHSLGFYADKMCLTERYLGKMIRNASGMTAKKWIDRATITAAKVMLRHTDKQVSLIAYELQFPNASFFCKFFRRMTGITPGEYREG